MEEESRMKVTRRRGLLALGVALVGILLNGFFFERLRSVTTLLRAPRLVRNGRDAARTHRMPSRRVEPAPHSVKRHG
jgi:hypothetical protein